MKCVLGWVFTVKAPVILLKHIFEFVFNIALASGSSVGKALSKILLTNWLFTLKWHSGNQFPNEQDVLGLIPGRAFFLFPLPFLSFFLFFFFFFGGGGGRYCTFIQILYIFFSLLASFLLFAINPNATRGSVMYVFVVFLDCLNC